MGLIFDVVFTRDETGKAIRIDYSLIGFPVNTWFAVFLNDVKVIRFKTDTLGEKVGYLDSIPSTYDIALTCVGNLHAQWDEASDFPISGVVFGSKTTVFVELIDDDGENQDRVGDWSLDVRYD